MPANNLNNQTSQNSQNNVSDTASREQTSRRAANTQGRSDQERSIQTGREGNRSTGVARRGQTSPVYGSGAATGQFTPFTLMRRMAEDMDRLFENFAPGFGRSLSRDLWGEGQTRIDQAVWSPQVETFRRGDKLVIRADLPGLKKEDVKVEVENGILSISGERCEEHEEDRDDFYRSERSYGQFYRALPLPDGINDEACEATFKDGVLEVTLPAPKEAERKAKQIPVR